MILTFQQHLRKERISEDLVDLPWLQSGITLATKMVEARIRRAGLTDLHGSANATNVQGEVQQNWKCTPMKRFFTVWGYVRMSLHSSRRRMKI